jgi:hypothetical protein
MLTVQKLIAVIHKAIEDIEMEDGKGLDDIVSELKLAINYSPDESRTVNKHKDDKEKWICDIPGCGKVAPQNDIFCKDHR